jgi:antitoxin component YwqK of YwqJK toxin-antitoxin module
MNNGQKHGQQFIYSPSGLILEQKTFVDGELNGSYKESYTNGKVYMEATYKNGQLHGVKKVYDMDGNLFSVENFDQDIIHGEATYYNTPDKKPIKVQFYYGHEVKK